MTQAAAPLRDNSGHNPITSISSYQDKWCPILRKIGSQPLSLCPEFPALAQRWEAWWRFEADRPLLLAQVTKPGGNALQWGKALDLLDQPDAWLDLRRKQIENTRYVGDTLPRIRVDIGPVAMAAFMGAPLHLSSLEQTTWQDTVIEDWSDSSQFEFDPANRWFRTVLELCRLTARDARNRYVVCLPDMTGSIDVLSNMRGPERLCMDLFEHREEVKQAAMKLVDAWEHAYALLYNTVLEEGAGVVQWLKCWSDTLYTLPTCDFNALIGESDFIEVCLPSLAEQARRAGRCIFHLDGPDASRHAPALAAEKSITAVQYTPGAGTESALAKIDMFKMLQKAGKPVLVVTPFEEVKELIDRLDPAGLVVWVNDCSSNEQADTLMDLIHKRFG